MVLEYSLKQFYPIAVVLVVVVVVVPAAASGGSGGGSVGRGGGGCYCAWRGGAKGVSIYR